MLVVIGNFCPPLPRSCVEACCVFDVGCVCEERDCASSRTAVMMGICLVGTGAKGEGGLFSLLKELVLVEGEAESVGGGDAYWKGDTKGTVSFDRGGIRFFFPA